MQIFNQVKAAQTLGQNEGGFFKKSILMQLRVLFGLCNF
jgi:hypothetical protein